MDNAKLKEKINLIMSNILKEKNFVSPIDVLINIDVLSTKDLENCCQKCMIKMNKT